MSPIIFTPDNVTTLEPHQIYVFGSNTEGRHGKGAAETALKRFGARYGQAEGPQGRAYAIITKDLRKGLKSIPLEDIGSGIDRFLEYAQNNQDKEFVVVRLGSSLAGYTVEEIAALFRSRMIPANVRLPIEYANIPGLNKFCNHSGGAKGGDTAWDMIGRKYGFIRHNHYREPGQTVVDSYELRRAGISAIPISAQDYDEGQVKATAASRQMGRIDATQQVRNKYVLRNWAQVKYSTEVFAVAHLIKSGEDLEHGRKAKCTQVSGGTGYAVQMALLEGKRVHVFDQKRNAWYTFDREKNAWVKEETPVLSENFAGIGSRNLEENGRAAIEAVYRKTIEMLAAA